INVPVQPMNLLYHLWVQMDKSCCVPAHHPMHSPQPVSHRYGYPGQRPEWCARLQEQKAVNDASFQQIRSWLLFQQPDVFQSAMSVQCLDALCQARTVLQFASRSTDVLAAESFLNCIQSQCVPMVQHLRHPLSGPERFLDGHAASPINDVKALCSGFQRNRNNHGIFYRLLSFLQKQPNFSALQFWQKWLSVQWSARYFAPSHQSGCAGSHQAGFQYLGNLHG